jgi:hypothetical protein
MAANERPHAVHASDKRKPHILQAAEARLRGDPDLAMTNVSCTYRQGVLTLRGSLSSYYLKQLAQDAVGQVAGVEHIHNLIQVIALPQLESPPRMPPRRATSIQTPDKPGSPATTRALPDSGPDARLRLSLAVKVLVRSTVRVIQGFVLNIWSQRIDLLLSEGIEIGALVTVFPIHPELGQSPALTACVICAQPQTGRHCYAGCAFLRPLTQAELNEFLA